MTSSVTQSGNFAFATPIVGFLIPVPSGWKFTDKGNECYLEDTKGSAVKLKIHPADQNGPERLEWYCIRWEVREKNEYDDKWNIIGKKQYRKGYKRSTNKVLEWLVNQK